jgi:pantoate--beta-alanine ligase
MIIFKHAKALSEYLEKRRSAAQIIGFVPTMGALHEGHLSLLKECTHFSRISVCSIFVNPTQFNNPDDFEKYPHTIEKDISLLEANGCDVLFLPDEKEIYPDETWKSKHYDLGYFETILEGKFRPGHFQGVCLVVERLLNIVNPDLLFLGRKDFQQCMIIKRLIELMDEKIKVVICPILREPNGLAMSSRNMRLNSSEKNQAGDLNRQLVFIKDHLGKKDFLVLKKEAIQHLQNSGFKVEYLELAKRNDLTLTTEYNDREQFIILVAAFLGEVRLIDNILIN